MQMTDKGYYICGGALQLWQTKNVERKQKMSNANNYNNIGNEVRKRRSNCNSFSPFRITIF